MNWVVFAGLSSLATALFVVFGAAATRYMSSATMNAIQASAMLGTTLVVSCLSGSVSCGQLGEAVKSKGLHLALLAGVFSAIAWITFFAADTLAAQAPAGSAPRVAAINSTYIVLLAIIEPVFRPGPPVTFVQGAGILLVLAGVVLVLLSR